MAVKDVYVNGDNGIFSPTIFHQLIYDTGGLGGQKIPPSYIEREDFRERQLREEEEIIPLIIAQSEELL